MKYGKLLHYTLYYNFGFCTSHILVHLILSVLVHSENCLFVYGCAVSNFVSFNVDYHASSFIGIKYQDFCFVCCCYFISKMLGRILYYLFPYTLHSFLYLLACFEKTFVYLVSFKRVMVFLIRYARKNSFTIYKNNFDFVCFAISTLLV